MKPLSLHDTLQELKKRSAEHLEYCDVCHLYASALFWIKQYAECDDEGFRHSDYRRYGR